MIKSHPWEAEGDASPAASVQCIPPGELVKMAQNPGTTFHMRNWYQNMGGETAGVTGQAQGERIFLLSTHQILMPSLLSWGEYWPALLLQSPENQRSLKRKGLESWLPSQQATFQW